MANRVYRTKNFELIICQRLKGFETNINSVLFSSFSLNTFNDFTVEKIIEQAKGIM